MDNNQIKKFLKKTFSTYNIKSKSINQDKNSFVFKFEPISDIESEKVQFVTNYFFEYFNLLKIKLGSNVIDKNKYEKSLNLLLDNFLTFIDNNNLTKEQNYKRTKKIMNTYSEFQKEFVNSLSDIDMANKLLKSYSGQLIKNGYFEIN